MRHSLRGKVALVTGATRLAGLGAAMANALASAGADIGLSYFRAFSGVRGSRVDHWTDHPLVGRSLSMRFPKQP
jgi:NAD(P)-dependent dehydrogenase (short-subunit alcohol dehydrogenase family)